ncbi:ATP-grasp domain-containing protein [Methyloceanibacter superfactus]|uniref:ATP-grasp domain-containing protein n=1 Tax=Methyloceanibacter superfactus TaxID=1774969 RepID=UPI000AFAE3B7|nr:ATP-grasp domain-containing protein [Methyloceanibacter superfactus]
MPSDIAHGFQWRSLRPALEALAKQAPSPVLGAIYGSGFEDRPQLLARIAARMPLLGNDAATVKAIKAPETFFGTLERLGIPHPETREGRPAKGAGWIAKRRGGAGGSHVVPSRLQKDADDIYFQRWVAGRAISALFVANGRRCRVIGFSEQWPAPAPRRPWRYGGAVRPANLTKAAEAEMTRAVARVVSAFGLKGLGSADFVLTENQPLLLEINPRPGATLDVFAGAAKSLLGLHVDAVKRGRLPREGLAFEGAAASTIIHAPKRLIVPRSMIWPSWAADLPKPGEQIDKQRPICTLLARAGTRGRAKRLVETRKASLLAKIQKSQGEQCEQEKERRKCSETDEAAEHQHPSRTAGARHHR